MSRRPPWPRSALQMLTVAHRQEERSAWLTARRICARVGFALDRVAACARVGFALDRVAACARIGCALDRVAACAPPAPAANDAAMIAMPIVALRILSTIPPCDGSQPRS